MRELTIDEIEVASGGTGDQNPNISPGEMMTVSATRISGNFFLSTGPSFGGVPSLALGNFSIASLAPDFQAAAEWDKDGDGVADYQDEDPDDPNKNTMVVTAEYNPTAGAIAKFVAENWSTFLSGLGAKYGASTPFRSTVGSGVAGNETADYVRTATYLITEYVLDRGEADVRFAREHGQPTYFIP